MKVALLHDESAEGGRPDEQDALVQVAAIEEVLRARGDRTERVALGLDLAQASRHLRDGHFDLAFNLVESVAGHGRLIHLAPALLEALRIPFTGVRSDSMFLTSHKVWTKRVLRSAGLPTPDWHDTTGQAGFEPGRFVIKSVWEDASLGLDDDSVLDARDRKSLLDELRRREPGLGGEAFAEAWIEGREFNLSVLETADGPKVLPPAEMCFVDYPPDKPRLVGYRAKWDPDSFEYNATVRRFGSAEADAGLVARMVELSAECWRRFCLTGYARVDFRVDAAGRPWILELNPNPCISPDAGFVAAAEHTGLDLAAIVDHLIESALTGGPGPVVGSGAPPR